MGVEYRYPINVLENSDVNVEYVMNYLFDDMSKSTFSREDILKITRIASNFSKWEEKYVYSLEDGYESFRDLPNGGFDYDEILEMYVDTIFFRLDRWMATRNPCIRWDDGYQWCLAFVLPKLDKEGFKQFKRNRKKLNID